jgi:hypothetical protein
LVSFFIFLLLEESAVVLRGKGSEKVSFVCTNFTLAVLIVVFESMSLAIIFKHLCKLMGNKEGKRPLGRPRRW